MNNIFTEYINGIPNIKKLPTIALCGSEKFKDDIEKIQKDLLIKGYLPLTAFFGLIEDEKNQRIINNQKRIINVAECVYVINKDGFVDDSTKSAIEYAIEIGKKVYYMEENKI